MYILHRAHAIVSLSFCPYLSFSLSLSVSLFVVDTGGKFAAGVNNTGGK
jgi:hypothetical protein